MRRQPERRIAQLVNQYPALGQVRASWKWTNERKFDRVPAFAITIEKPDPDHLRAVPDCVLDHQSHLQHPNGTFIGTRHEYVVAVGEDDRILAATSGPGRDDWWELARVGDVFVPNPTRDAKGPDGLPKRVDPELVKCLFLVSACRWYLFPSAEEVRRKGGWIACYPVDTEVSVVVLPRRKDYSWQQLLEMTDRHQALCEAAEKVVKTHDWKQRERILQDLLTALKVK